MVPVGDLDEVVGIGCEEVRGRVDQLIQIIALGMFWANVGLGATGVIFALHCAKQIADIDDAGVSLLGLLKVLDL